MSTKEQRVRFRQRGEFLANIATSYSGIIRNCLKRGVLTDEELERIMRRFLYDVTRSARADEIDRIRVHTLDANDDVWSMDDDGNMVSLSERLEGLAHARMG